MPRAIRTTPGLVRRTDLFRVDPRQVAIRDHWNPRTDLKLDLLIESIREHGVLVPIRVRKNAAGVLELVDGERRLRATMQLIDAGVELLDIPAIVEHYRSSDADLLVAALVTNTGEPLSVADEADAFRRLVGYGLTIPLIAKKIGRSDSYVHNRLTYLQAEEPVQEALADKTISTTDAVKIIKRAVRTGEDQADVLDHLTANKVDKRTKAAKEIPTETRCARLLQPIIDKFGLELVKELCRCWPVLDDKGE